MGGFILFRNHTSTIVSRGESAQSRMTDIFSRGIIFLKEHPTTQAQMRKVPEVSEFIGDKETFNRLIKDMACTMNSDEFGYRKESDWKIYFHDFKKYYGDSAETCEDEEDFGSDEEYEEFADQTMRIDGLYYNRTFTYDEINSIIEGILSTKTLDTKSAAQLIEKVEQNLTTKFYKKGPKQEDNPARRIKVDYTFLHDWFGDQFRFIETEKTVPYDDIVKVECSPFAMVHWALQYSDRVEVTAPEEVRNAVVEKIRNLNVKYGLEE